jgi:hypothetical protein
MFWGFVMKSLIAVTFAFLAFAFYEMSGGDEFVPRKAEMIEAARLADAEREEDAGALEKPLLAQASATPEPVLRPVADAGSDVTLIRASAPDPRTPVITPLAEPLIVNDTLEVAAAHPSITLVSLSQSATQFAQPTARLNEPAPTGAASADIREVAGSWVNLRGGPGTGYDVLTSLQRGTEVEVLEADGYGWVRLRDRSSDNVGWMAESLLTDPQG